ncbi:hypothetical protein [Bradyrhizobium sp. BR 1432]|uniref:hypothetical protein n=1 Tax=Bradyrhizobium sp. BR 1432 TaxID=3447966 RepID=UPI003EE80053
MTAASERMRNETLWKLTDARCAQLTDSISNARAPFFLGLAWAFLWAWALYNVDVGYLNVFQARYERLSALAASPAQPDHDELTKNWCPKVAPGLYQRVANIPMDAATPQDKLELCKSIIKLRLEWVSKGYLESTLITFPGGFARLHISDLGIVGQTGLLPILAWAFFAIRRENHAFRAIVDMTPDSRKVAGLFPKRFDLTPNDPYLSAEHLAYAYHAVAQRFVFIFARYSSPLLSLTLLLCAFPALVAGWNAYTDVRDIFKIEFFDPSLIVRTLIEIVLYLIVCLLTCLCVRYVLDSTVLLNGWYLAVRDVWMEEWDETNNAKAEPVTIDVSEQKAFPGK